MYRTTVQLHRMHGDTLADLCALMASHNERVLAAGRYPLLYRSGVVYQTARTEGIRDIPLLLAAGAADCDELAPWRVAELRTFGTDALLPTEPRDHVGPLEAECVVQHQGDANGSRLFHIAVRYRSPMGRWFRDDPSGRLGMYEGQVDGVVLSEWHVAGVRARRVPRGG